MVQSHMRSYGCTCPPKTGNSSTLSGWAVVLIGPISKPQSQKVRLQRLLTVLGGKEVVNTLEYLEIYKTKSIQFVQSFGITTRRSTGSTEIGHSQPNGWSYRKIMGSKEIGYSTYPRWMLGIRTGHAQFVAFKRCKSHEFEASKDSIVDAESNPTQSTCLDHDTSFFKLFMHCVLTNIGNYDMNLA